MPAPDRRYAASLSLGVLYAPVAFVLVHGQGADALGGSSGCGFYGHSVLQSDVDDAVHIPSLIQFWEPLGRVLVGLMVLLTLREARVRFRRSVRTR